MGWCSGSELAEQVWEQVQPHIPIAGRQRMAETILSAFEEHDADCWEEEEGGLLCEARPEQCSPDPDDLSGLLEAFERFKAQGTLEVVLVYRGQNRWVLRYPEGAVLKNGSAGSVEQYIRNYSD